MNNKNIKTLDSFIDDKIGKLGTAQRHTFEEGYESFKIGEMLRQARIQKGLSTSQLADIVGIDKSSISKFENNTKDIKFTTLQKIINQGLGGHLNISFTL